MGLNQDTYDEAWRDALPESSPSNYPETGVSLRDDIADTIRDAKRWRDLMDAAKAFYVRYPHGQYVLPKESL